MKKILSLFCFFVICLSANAEGDKFVDSLRNCSPYKDSGIVSTSGIEAKSNKQMIGWKNDRCVYIETVEFGTNKVTTVCKFTRPQIQEITSVADAYYLTLKYTNENVDTSSVNAVKNNPIIQVLNKYLQDPDVCTMSGLE